jgi:hypothetical protein
MKIFVPDAAVQLQTPRSGSPCGTAARTNYLMNKNLRCGLVVLLFSSLACKPVLAIGWNEFMFLFLLITVLLGPPLYRFIRRAEEFLKHEKRKK